MANGNRHTSNLVDAHTNTSYFPPVNAVLALFFYKLLSGIYKPIILPVFV
jgi:hypothetical protein